MSTLDPVRRSSGARSTMVIRACLKARSSQKAKALPAIPEPEMRMFGDDIFGFRIKVEDD